MLTFAVSLVAWPLPDFRTEMSIPSLSRDGSVILVVVANPITSETMFVSRSWVQAAVIRTEAANKGMMCFMFIVR